MVPPGIVVNDYYISVVVQNTGLPISLQLFYYYYLDKVSLCVASRAIAYFCYIANWSFSLNLGLAGCLLLSGIKSARFLTFSFLRMASKLLVSQSMRFWSKAYCLKIISLLTLLRENSLQSPSLTKSSLLVGTASRCDGCLLSYSA